MLASVITVHTINLYTDYCEESDALFDISDACDTVIPRSVTIKTLDIVTTAAGTFPR